MSVKLHTILEESSRFNVNTAHFSPEDFQIFVDSLETIARIERKKIQRRQKRKDRQRLNNTTARLHDHSDNSSDTPTPSGDEAEDEPVTHLEAKNVLPIKSSDDEDAYFSGNNSANTSPRNSLYYDAKSHLGESQHELCSDSEESSVFPVGQELPIYENIAPLRPRSTVITHTRERTIRSRIIEAVRKRDLAQRQNHHLDAEMGETKTWHFKSFSLRKKKTKICVEKQKHNEDRFFTRAFRYLTL